MNLSREIEDYAFEKERICKRGEKLRSFIEELFRLEFEKIKQKVPEGYKISSFLVQEDSQKRFEVVILNPYKNSCKENYESQLNRLNLFFREDFNRIKGEYGFNVSFDRVIMKQAL